MVMDNICIFTLWLAIMNSCLFWKTISFVFMLDTYLQRPFSMAVRSKVQFCGLSITGISVWNPTAGMEVCLWTVLCVGS
jgi:hypothetical protein